MGVTSLMRKSPSVSLCRVLLSLADMHLVVLMEPTWQAIVPELVEVTDLENAAALNSLNVNIARARWVPPWVAAPASMALSLTRPDWAPSAAPYHAEAARSLRRRWLILIAALVTAAALSFPSVAAPQWTAMLGLPVLGAAWITVLTTFNGVAQAILPN